MNNPTIKFMGSSNLQSFMLSIIKQMKKLLPFLLLYSHVIFTACTYNWYIEVALHVILHYYSCILRNVIHAAYQAKQIIIIIIHYTQETSFVNFT